MELKFIDYELAANPLSATWAGGEEDPAGGVLCINACATGTGASDRDGRKMVMKSVQLEGELLSAVQQDQADVLQAAYVTVALVWDKQTNSAQMSAEDVYLDTANIPECQLRNLQYQTRFKVLWVKKFVLQPSTTGSDGANTMSTGRYGARFSVYRKLNIPVTFDGVTAVVADIADNSLHVIACCSVGAQVQMAYNSRVRFVG